MTTEKQSRVHLRGFASMDPLRQREIASKGGRAAHASGRAHTFTSAEAVAAGRKGGTTRWERKRMAAQQEVNA